MQILRRYRIKKVWGYWQVFSASTEDLDYDWRPINRYGTFEEARVTVLRIIAMREAVLATLTKPKLQN